MAQPSIVSCPGCGKRYSIPEGAAPGQFQCQDCSSVVAYGQAAGSPAGGGKPHGPATAKHAGRAAAARRKVQARHAAEEEEDDDRGRRHAPHGPPKQHHDAMPYILGIVTLAILAGGAVFLFQKSRREEPKVASSDARKKKGSGEVVEEAGEAPVDEGAAGGASKAPPPPPPAAAPPPAAPPPAGGGLRAEPKAKGAAPPEKFEPAANPPEGGNYGKSQGELLMMLKKERGSVVVPLEHLPDTGPDLRTRIDADVALISDPNTGSDALHAIDRLAKVGRPAIPRVLAATAGLDFSKYKDIREALDPCKVADAVDAVLKKITAYDKIPDLQFSPTGDLSAYPKAVEDWYIWWFSNGYRRATFYKPAEEVEDSL